MPGDKEICLLIVITNIILVIGQSSQHGIVICHWYSQEIGQVSPMNKTDTSKADIIPADNWIEGEINITFMDFVNATITAEYRIYKINITGYGTMTADDIRAEANNNLSIRDTLSKKVEGYFKAFINHTFPEIDLETDLKNTYVMPENNSFVVDEDTEPYRPPIIYNVGTDIIFNKKTYKLAEYDVKDLNGLLMGILCIGAKYSVAYSIKQQAGFLMEYTFMFADTNIQITSSEDEDPRTNVVKRTIDNRMMITDVEFELPIVLCYTKPVIIKEEDIEIETTVDLRYIPHLTMAMKISIASMNVSAELAKKEDWKEHVSDLNYINADGIRCLYYNGILSLDNINNRLSKEIDTVIGRFRDEIIDTELNYSIEWNSTKLNPTPLYMIKAMRFEPEVECIVGFETTVLATFRDKNIDSEFILGVLNSGAIVNLNLTPPSLPHETKYRIVLPPRIIISGSDDLTPIYTGNDSTIFLWIPKERVNASIMSTLPSANRARNLLKANSKTDIIIDISEAYIYSPSNIIVDLTVDVSVHLGYLSLIATNMSKLLPEPIKLDYINSDLIRLAIYKKIISKEIFDNISSEIQKRVGCILGVDIPSNSGFENLDWNPEIDQIECMDDVPNIEYHLRFRASVNLLKISQNTDGYVEFYGTVLFQRTLVLEFEGIEGFETCYKIRLPKGVEFLNLRNHADIARRYKDKGISVLEVTIPPDNPKNATNIQIDVGVTIWFFLYKMCIQLILAFVLLISSIAIAIEKRKLRRLMVKDFDRDKRYEDEDIMANWYEDTWDSDKEDLEW